MEEKHVLGAEAAKLLGLTKKTVYALAEAGELRMVRSPVIDSKCDNRRLFSVPSLYEFIMRNHLDDTLIVRKYGRFDDTLRRPPRAKDIS